LRTLFFARLALVKLKMAIFWANHEFLGMDGTDGMGRLAIRSRRTKKQGHEPASAIAGKLHLKGRQGKLCSCPLRPLRPLRLCGESKAVNPASALQR
jgi:hypothetical protein